MIVVGGFCRSQVRPVPVSLRKNRRSWGVCARQGKASEAKSQGPLVKTTWGVLKVSLVCAMGFGACWVVVFPTVCFCFVALDALGVRCIGCYVFLLTSESRHVFRFHVSWAAVLKERVELVRGRGGR